MSNRPIAVVELERRRLEMAASPSKDLEVIILWGLKNMVPKRALGSNEQPGSAKKSLIQALSITENMITFRRLQQLLGKSSDIYSEPSNLLTLYKAQIIPSLEYCSHISGAGCPYYLVYT
nr:unnamed protein product [Callosobruchus chinensis]